MKNIKNHMEAIESYINGNITDFKKYVKGLSKTEFLECTIIFCEDYNYSMGKMLCLLD